MEERKNKLLLIVGVGVASFLILCIIILLILLYQSRKEEKALKMRALDPTEVFEEEMELETTNPPLKAQASQAAQLAEATSVEQKQTANYETAQTDQGDQAKGSTGSRSDLPDLSDHRYQQLTGGESLSLIFRNPSGEVQRQGIYRGERKNGRPHGQGAFASQNSSGIAWIYVGDFVEGRAEGRGIAVWADSYDYSDGKGYRQYFDGDFRDGAFVDGSIRSYSEHGQSSHSGNYPRQTPEFPSLPADFPADFPKPSFPSNDQTDNFLEF